MHRGGRGSAEISISQKKLQLHRGGRSSTPGKNLTYRSHTLKKNLYYSYPFSVRMVVEVDFKIMTQMDDEDAEIIEGEKISDIQKQLRKVSNSATWLLKDIQEASKSKNNDTDYYS